MVSKIIPVLSSPMTFSLSCWATSLPSNGPAELSVVLNTSFGTLGPCPVLNRSWLFSALLEIARLVTSIESRDLFAAREETSESLGIQRALEEKSGDVALVCLGHLLSLGF